MAIGGSWRLLETPGSSWKLPGWRASRLIRQTPQGHKSSRQASGGFWRPLEASGMAVEPKSVKKALEFTAKLRFRASRNAVVAPEVVGE